MGQVVCGLGMCLSTRMESQASSSSIHLPVLLIPVCGGSCRCGYCDLLDVFQL